MNPLRLKGYKTFLNDGKSSAEFRHCDKKMVLVAMLIGEEPLTITCDDDYLDVDDVILRMAKSIRRAHKLGKVAKEPV